MLVLAGQMLKTGPKCYCGCTPRWGEKEGYKVRLSESSPGDEAGIKSATLEIGGTLCLRIFKRRKRNSHV